MLERPSGSSPISNAMALRGFARNCVTAVSLFSMIVRSSVEISEFVEGFIDRKDAKFEKVVIRGDAFKQWFDDPRQPAKVLEYLVARKAVSAQPQRGAVRSGPVVKFETQTLWPDGSRPRSITARLPKSFRKSGVWVAQKKTPLNIPVRSGGRKRAGRQSG